MTYSRVLRNNYTTAEVAARAWTLTIASGALFAWACMCCQRHITQAHAPTMRSATTPMTMYVTGRPLLSSFSFAAVGAELVPERAVLGASVDPGIGTAVRWDDGMGVTSYLGARLGLGICMLDGARLGLGTGARDVGTGVGAGVGMKVLTATLATEMSLMPRRRRSPWAAAIAWMWSSRVPASSTLMICASTAPRP